MSIQETVKMFESKIHSPSSHRPKIHLLHEKTEEIISLNLPDYKKL